MKTNGSTNDTVIDAAPIRLTADETRLVWKLMQSNGTPQQAYSGCSLVELGLAKKVSIAPKEDFTAKRAEAWVKLATAAKVRDKKQVSSALSTIEECDRNSKREESGYVLTERGKQVARGLTIRWNTQYAPKDNCRA